MNKDQAKGVGKQVAGEVQQQAGKLTGDTGTTLRGHAREAEGKVQKKLGDAKEAVKHESRELDRTSARKTGER